MSYPPEHKERTRQRIVESAARLFKRQGLENTGIDAVMADAGLTRGGFYAHFSSKDELFAEAMRPPTFYDGETLESLADKDRLRRILEVYLSRGHRDDPGDGCPLPALAGDVAHSDGRARKPYARLVVGLAKIVERAIAGEGKAKAEKTALATVALMVGGLVLARALGRGKLSDRVLGASRDAALQLTGIDDGTTRRD